FSDPRRGAFADVRVLNGKGQGTLKAVNRALDELAKANTSADDTVVVYVSSHGTLARDARGELRRYLVVRDSRLKDIPGTALAMDTLKAKFDGLRSRKKLLVLATCHSGAGKSLLPANVQKELDGVKAGFFVRPLEESSRASIVLAACDWGETAREDERLQNDIYTHFFLEALAEGYDRNGDGAVTATEAHDYARQKTWTFTGGRQRPSAETLMVGTDPVALVGGFRSRGAPELFSYAASLDGFSVKVDGNEAGSFPGGVVLKKGAQRVQIAKGGSTPIFDRELNLDAGQRVAVEDLLAEEAPRFTFSARAGMQNFLDQQVRRDVAGLTPAFGLSFWVRDLPLPKTALALDLGLATGARSFRPVASGPEVPYRFVSTALGVGVPYVYRWERVAIGIGPRLSALYLSKRYSQTELLREQSFFTLTPGAQLSAAWALTERLELGVEAQMHYLLMRVNDDNRGMGFGQLWGGVGYRL
ncbi:MAG: caspase domain-containing protein, partial [Myxococcales bacterium]